MSEEPGKKPKIIIDNDWKEQVQAEKEALRKQAAAGEAAPQADSQADAKAGGEPPNRPEAIPPASFALLVSSFATQVLIALGQVGDPAQQEPPQVDLTLGKHYIDMLGVLEEKTKGNLTGEEAAMLENVLHELRMLFVAVGNAQ